MKKEVKWVSLVLTSILVKVNPTFYGNIYLFFFLSIFYKCSAGNLKYFVVVKYLHIHLCFGHKIPLQWYLAWACFGPTSCGLSGGSQFPLADFRAHIEADCLMRYINHLMPLQSITLHFPTVVSCDSTPRFNKSWQPSATWLFTALWPWCSCSCLGLLLVLCIFLLFRICPHHQISADSFCSLHISYAFNRAVV